MKENVGEWKNENVEEWKRMKEQESKWKQRKQTIKNENASNENEKKNERKKAKKGKNWWVSWRRVVEVKFKNNEMVTRFKIDRLNELGRFWRELKWVLCGKEDCSNVAFLQKIG